MTQLLITLKDQSYLPNIRRIVKMMKRSFISLLAVVAVGISVPTVSFASSLGDPIGGIAYITSGEYYEIDSKEDLHDLAVYVNGTGTYSTNTAETTAHDCLGLTFKMTLNIDFKPETAWNDAISNEDNYEPIGGYHNGDKRYFKGTFLGQGHTIRGIRVYRGGNDKDTDSYVGIFGLIGCNATVSGIVLTNARLTGFNNVGGIVGMAILDKVGSDKSTIDGCTVTGAVAIHAVQGGSESHGGIVGGNHYYPSSVKNCVSSVTLTIGEGLTSQYYGGISGWNNGGILDDNIVVGATIPGCKQSANGTPDFYGAITGYGTGSHRNYYARCTVAGVENAVNVGQRGCDDDYGATYSAHTIWFDDGITAEPTFTFDGNSYYAARRTVTLNIPTSDGNIFLYTVNDDDGHSISVFKDKFTMPAQNVVVTGKFVPTVDTPYFDPTAPEGEQQKSHPAVELTTDTPMPLTGGWYVVHGNVTLSKTLPLGNDATLILADGAHLKFAIGNGMPIGGHGINGSDSNGNALCSLTVYAQSDGTGKLTINAWAWHLCTQRSHTWRHDQRRIQFRQRQLQFKSVRHLWTGRPYRHGRQGDIFNELCK